MKKLLFILLTTFLSSGIYTQGNNLQFSQALVVTLVNTETVPAGKVWKIVSAGSSLPTINYASTGGIYFQVNSSLQVYLHRTSTLQYYANGPNSFSSSMTNNLAFPMWLPAGSTVSQGSGVNFLSVVEFNIVQ
jgi:hypothetical protein